RIEGTIEVQWNRPLPQRVPVALWLADQPASRDSVEMLLGSPRGFVLEAQGCGPHRLRYRTIPHPRFRRPSPAPIGDGGRAGAPQRGADRGVGPSRAAPGAHRARPGDAPAALTLGATLTKGLARSPRRE